MDEAEPHIKSLSKSALDFYMGAKLAIDEKSNLTEIKLEAYFIDCEYKTEIIHSDIIPKLNEMKPDLIFGPFHLESMKDLSDYCNANKVTVISPLVNSDSCLSVNPYMISLRTDDLTYIDYLGKILNQEYISWNLSLICESNQEKTNFVSNLKTKIDTNSFPSIQAYRVDETNWRGSSYTKDLKSGKNVFIITKNSDVVINSVLTNLMWLPAKENISLIIPYQLLNNTTIDLGFLQSLNSVIIADFYVDYANSRYFDFISTFRDKYNTEPGILAFRSYYSTRLFINQMIEKGVFFQRDGIVVSDSAELRFFQFSKRYSQKGFQNNKMSVLRFIENELHEISVK
jgi:hypothetical protein